MAAYPTTATPARSLTVGRIAERIVILAIAIAVVLTAYSKMGGEAESAVAQANLAAITPLAHAYAVDQGDYLGMTIRALQQRYDPGLDPTVYTLVDRGPDDFCIASMYSGRTWHTSAMQDEPTAGGC